MLTTAYFVYTIFNMKKPSYHFLLIPYVLLNGMATGQLVSFLRYMRDNGYDDDLLLPTIMTAGAGLYTIKRIQDIWRENHNQNQK